MRAGHRSPLVDRWIADYRAVFGRLQLGSPREQLGFQELLTEARNRTDGRRDRLSQTTPSVPTPLWLVLVLGGCVAILLQLAMADPRAGMMTAAGQPMPQPIAQPQPQSASQASSAGSRRPGRIDRRKARA